MIPPMRAQSGYISQATGGDTDQQFPFGFVQLAPNREGSVSPHWPVLRWKQTASLGYVPNQLMENVFMAVAMDDDIDLHPKNKRLPATRLGWAAINLVYGRQDLPLQGPQVLRVDEESPEGLRDVVTGINVTFSASLRAPALEADRFMVCCMERMELCDEKNYGQEQGWQGINMVGWVGGDGEYFISSPALLLTTDLLRNWSHHPRPGSKRGLSRLWPFLRAGLPMAGGALQWRGGLPSLL